MFSSRRSWLKAASFALVAVTAIACSSPSEEPQGADENDIVQNTGPVGTFVTEQSVSELLGEETLLQVEPGLPNLRGDIKELVGRTYLLLRSDKKFFGQIVLECKSANACSDRSKEMIVALHAIFEWGENGAQIWGSYDIKDQDGKKMISYKLAADAPPEAQAMKASIEQPEELKWDGTTLGLKGAKDPGLRPMKKAPEGRCHEEADCMNQGLPMVRCPGKQYECTSNVCRRPQAGCAG